jgi:hypothetical protein
MSTGILGKRVNALPPIDLNGGKTTEPVSMKNHWAIEFIVQLGVSGGAVPTLTVDECTTEAVAASTAIAFDYQSCLVDYATNSTCDVFGELTAVASTGLALSTTNNVFYRVVVFADRLTDGYPYVRLSFSDPSASVIGAVVAILHDSRYGKELEGTVRV